VLEELGAVALLGQLMAPLMLLVGLPPAMGLAWAAAIATNVYGGIAAFVAVVPDLSLSTAQVSIFAVLVLTAHALPLEGAIVRQAGVRLRFMLALRVFGALAFGMVLHQCYRLSGTLQEPSRMGALPAIERPENWADWGLVQLQQLGAVVLMVAALLILLRLLRVVRVDALLALLLRPLLRLVGLGREALPMSLVGMLLGLSYGGGLLIAEARSGRLPRRQVVLCLSLIFLCHSLIEDTILLSLIGAHWSAILVGRTVLALIVVALLAACWRRWPRALERICTRELPTSA